MHSSTQAPIYMLYLGSMSPKTFVEWLKGHDIGRVVDARKKPDQAPATELTLTGGIDTHLARHGIEYVCLAEHAEFFFKPGNVSHRVVATLEWASRAFWDATFSYLGPIAVLCDEEDRTMRDSRNVVARYLKACGRDVVYV